MIDEIKMRPKNECEIRKSKNNKVIASDSKLLIVDSISKSRLKNLRFLVEKSDVFVTNNVFMKIIKINHL